MLKDLIPKTDPIHTRDISLSTHVHAQAGIIVHGILMDRRRLPIIDILGRPKEPGIVHHMTATLALAPDPLRIVRAEAEMHTVPVTACPQTLDRIQGLVGLEIKPGFSRRVKQAVGGTEGCLHMCSLITAMGTEMIHGWLTEKRSRNPKGVVDLDSIKETMFLIDSCRIWKKDGPRITEVQQALAALKEAD